MVYLTVPEIEKEASHVSTFKLLHKFSVNKYLRYLIRRREGFPMKSDEKSLSENLLYGLRKAEKTNKKWRVRVIYYTNSSKVIN